MNHLRASLCGRAWGTQSMRFGHDASSRPFRLKSTAGRYETAGPRSFQPEGEVTA
ncbi:hypothetical protein L842_3066 [Mycobacterium intracellulare MIN_052511_1280]|nr:hypothetical protein L842_3066 [Mycobacterium intracellulare MIN_052511_1280]